RHATELQSKTMDLTHESLVEYEDESEAGGGDGGFYPYSESFRLTDTHEPSLASQDLATRMFIPENEEKLFTESTLCDLISKSDAEQIRMSTTDNKEEEKKKSETTKSVPAPPPMPPQEPIQQQLKSTGKISIKQCREAISESASLQQQQSVETLKRERRLVFDRSGSSTAKKSELGTGAAPSLPPRLPTTAASLSSLHHFSQTSITNSIASEDVPTFDSSIGELLLLDVCPLGIGIEDIHGHMHTLIRRNTTIPMQTEFYPVFTNAYAYQTTATIRIFEGEHNLTKYNILLGEFSLTGLTSNFAAQTLEIAIRIEIDANGIHRVDAQEARSGVKASFTIAPSRLTKDQIERHITYVQSDADFAAKSVYDRQANDPLYLLDGQTEVVMHNFSGELIASSNQTTSTPLLSKLNDVQSTPAMIEELIKLQSEDGSFTLNKDLADVLHINPDIFNGLEHYLREQGFNSLALNIRNEILRLIGTGVILMWLVLQTQPSQQNKIQFLFIIEQIKVHLCNHLPANINEQMDKAIKFYQQTSQRIGIYCGQLELHDSSWDMFIQRIIIGNDHVNN
ncbi:unnamed protein product, partial [Rotaria sp. Silwood2]